jgi:NADH-quinone oxidoreductase E subunit
MSQEFSDDLKKWISEVTAHYPRKDAALLPVLHLAQKEFGYISPEVEKQVASLLDISPVKVREVLTFYTMFNRKTVGKYHIQVCSNLSCVLSGAESLLEYISKKLDIQLGETTSDGKFSLSAVECLGDCEQAPCMMVNFDYYGHLDQNKIDQLLDGLN